MFRRIVMVMGLAGVFMTQQARASFHDMQIEQVIAGVNGDTSAQAIQLRMRAAGQNFVSSARLVAVDATGSNPVVLVDFTHNVTNGSLGDRVLIATASMANYTSPTIVADFTMTNRIPDSYLSSGCIIYQNDAGSQILWRLCYGSYTGSTTGTLDNDDDGNFGPPFGGTLPSSGLDALKFQGGASDKSTKNQDDYLSTGSAAVLTNNARNSFTVVSGPDPCSGDETLSATCKTGTFKLVAKGKFYTAGVVYQLCIDGGTCMDVTANDKGKIKAVFKNVAPGSHSVNQTDCDLATSVDCS